MNGFFFSKSVLHLILACGFRETKSEIVMIGKIHQKKGRNERLENLFD